MTKLPLVSARELEKMLVKLGFRKVRQRGSHFFYRHSDGRYTTVPHHGNRVISRPLLREILREIDLKPEEYIKQLKS